MTKSARSCSSRTSRCRARTSRPSATPELAGHIDHAIAHFAAVAPLHFEHTGFDIAIGLLLRATSEWGIDGAEVVCVARGCLTCHIGGAEPPRHDRARA